MGGWGCYAFNFGRMVVYLRGKAFDGVISSGVAGRNLVGKSRTRRESA